MADFYLGLGANLGSRWTTLAYAIRHLDALPATRVTAVSSIYASKPVGLTDQPDFLNLVLRLETTLDAPALLANCLAIETALGRIRRERWGPRTIDIDLLHSPTYLISNDTLTLPHPRLWERSFVLVPLAEIAPALVIENRSVAEAARVFSATDLHPVAQLDWANPSECRSLLAGESDTANLRHPNRLQAGSYIQSSTACLPTLRPIALPAAPETIFTAVSDKPYAFLLDSAQPAGALGQFTFFGFNPFLIVRAHATGFTLTRPRTPDAPAETRTGDGLALLRELFARYRSTSLADWPFSGGAVGFFSYEFGRRLERVGTRRGDELEVPEFEWAFYDSLVAHNRTSGETVLIANPHGSRDAATIFAELEAVFMPAEVGRIIPNAPVRLQIATDSATPNPRRIKDNPPYPQTNAIHPTSNFTRDAYHRAIARIKDYIRSGDTYQVNLSQRFETPLPCPPYELFQRLRRLSPAPFASYLNFGDIVIVSSSPERLLRVRDGHADTRPIKGTRRRGSTPAEDAALRAELLSSEKDRAELLMICDLARNDLGRVCRPGTVRVDELFALEEHPTVFHLVANVSGQLAPERDVFDAIRALFPGGSITGAPKIRTMQIIDELELSRRHVYTGSIGYLGFDGNCDLNIAIRTLQCQHGRAYYHVGGGVVWDSVAENEYEETLVKGRAMHAALTEKP